MIFLVTGKRGSPLEQVRKRYRRQDPNTLVRCEVALVADYRVHQEIGQRRVDSTVKYLVSLTLLHASNPSAVTLNDRLLEGVRHGASERHLLVN